MTKKLRFIIFVLIVAWFGRDGARAQTNVDLRKTLCPGLENAFVVLSPVPLPSGGTANVPVCAVIGESLKFTTNAQGLLILEVTTGTAPQAPRLVTETFGLQAGIPATQETLAVLLQRTPIAGSDVLVFFKSSRVGADQIVAATPASGTNMRSFILRLPAYRPFAGDAFLFVYMTTEP